MRAAGLLLPLLVVLLPFEPRRPTLPVAGVEVTFLEAAAAVVTLLAAMSVRHRWRDVWRHRPWTLVALGAYAAVHVLSAAVAPHHPALALRFSLRMVAMAVFAAVVAASPSDVRRRCGLALAASAGTVALLAIGEGLGMRGLDPLLGLFREAPVHVAGLRRATAGSQHPNLAAAFLMYGLLAAAGSWERPRAVLLAALPLAAGLAFTYSRGAAAATVVGLMALAARERTRAVVSIATAAIVVLVVALGAVVAGGWRPTAAYGARYAPAETTMTLSPGETRRVGVRLTNTGREAWPADRFSLSYHWLRPGAHTTDDGPRPPLPESVPAGGDVAARVDITAPTEPGAYRLVLDLVRDDGTWLSGQGVPPAVVDVVVGGSAVAPPALAEPLVWQPPRAELWRLAIRLWREHPLLGAGPDNFRRLYGPAAGRAFWDDRVYANHTLLEAAATTGSLGALALAAVLLLTSWRTLRSTAADSATLFALAIGIIAHGLVDYVLAMTGHYLVFGLVVGAASAPPD